jgi:alpha-glucosidase
MKLAVPKSVTGWRGVVVGALMISASGRVQAAAPQSLRSPDGRLEVRIEAGDRLRWSLLFRGQPLLEDATLSLTVDQETLGLAPRLSAARRQSVEREIEVAVPRRAARLRERYHELRLEMRGGYAVIFRAYDEGVAYRFETALPASAVKVHSEEVGLRFAGEGQVYYPQEESFFSHNERHYLRLPLKDIAETQIASLPAVVELTGGIKIALAESDLEDYPGLWLRGTKGSGLAGTFPPYPLEERLERDRDYRVIKAAEYIALTRGRRRYPWRVFGLAEKDGDLLTNSLVYLLARPSAVADTSWIRPGKVAWDWWNANNLYGVDFKAGLNTETYKYYIDFATRYGIEYVILDEGWYPLGDLLKVVPTIDMETLLAYAKERNVGLILWVVWKTLDDQFEAALDKFEKWGVKGLKVDFMQRDDQKMMNFYERVCREAAKRKLLVDFHGAMRPALLTRTWPNLLTTEGVLGLEHSKWSANSHPQHAVTLPFTRLFAGPMDYTPGAMRNAARKSFAPVFDQPMSLGTRCQQLAMYVVYESPLQMLADTPSSYLREPEILEFLGPVPTVWEETRVLAAKMGSHVAVARRRGRDWWVGAMTDENARDLELDLSFLPPGRFGLDSYQDGVNADRWGSDYRRVKRDVDRTTTLKVGLAAGGGFAARLSPLP